MQGIQTTQLVPYHRCLCR